MAHLSYYNNLKNLTDIFYDSHVTLIEKVCLELGCPEKKEELVSKLLDSSVKLKAKKDKTAPKRNRSNFMLFSEEYRNQIMNKNPDLKLAEVSKELGKLWRQLKDKTKYNNLAEQDKERYNSEIEEYNNKLHLSSILQYEN